MESLLKIVSGGQTGVDRAALDAAGDSYLPRGGWCPKGRKAEDGPIDEKYPLKETDSEKYSVRTKRNVRDSDGTLILSFGPPAGGTALTVKYVGEMKKPLLLIDLNYVRKPDVIRAWIVDHAVKTLNIAGPRETNPPSVYQPAYEFLMSVFSELRNGKTDH